MGLVPTIVMSYQKTAIHAALPTELEAAWAGRVVALGLLLELQPVYAPCGTWLCSGLHNAKLSLPLRLTVCFCQSCRCLLASFVRVRGLFAEATEMVIIRAPQVSALGFISLHVACPNDVTALRAFDRKLAFLQQPLVQLAVLIPVQELLEVEEILGGHQTRLAGGADELFELALPDGDLDLRLRAPEAETVTARIDEGVLAHLEVIGYANVAPEGLGSLPSGDDWSTSPSNDPRVDHVQHGRSPHTLTESLAMLVFHIRVGAEGEEKLDDFPARVVARDTQRDRSILVGNIGERPVGLEIRPELVEFHIDLAEPPCSFHIAEPAEDGVVGVPLLWDVHQLQVGQELGTSSLLLATRDNEQLHVLGNFTPHQQGCRCIHDATSEAQTFDRLIPIPRQPNV
mmetsp:Transcript_81807/g.227826  ORF Transcript_81807/g.227826 Transcript_81807/m.227826 type:complete len:400 (+) Transcript_81807:255-1454(+)